MTVDLRGFSYELEPLLRRREWERDALLAQLGRAQREVERTDQELETLRTRLRADSEHAARAVAARLDPATHTRILRWLVRLQGAVHAAETELARLRSAREELAATCAAQQQKLEVLERHRDSRLEAYVREEEARMASAIDREWLARSAAGFDPGRRAKARGRTP